MIDSWGKGGGGGSKQDFENAVCEDEDKNLGRVFPRGVSKNDQIHNSDAQVHFPVT